MQRNTEHQCVIITSLYPLILDNIPLNNKKIQTFFVLVLNSDVFPVWIDFESVLTKLN